MLLLLGGTGLFLSLRLGFPQLLQLGRILRETAGSLLRRRPSTEDGGLSPFQALSTALAGTVGTGNIAGVTGAILLGGPGAVFWMWLAAFFGTATKYAEIALAVRFRVTDAKGRPCGGPMYTIERGLGALFRPLAIAFALAGCFACFGIGNLAQSCEIAAASQELFRASPLAVGLSLSILVAVILFGGLRRIGRLTGLLVPLMSGLYLFCTLPILLLHAAELPGLMRLILRSAFGLRAAEGAAFGWTLRTALRHGFARGIFSNEAGLGSAPMAHAAASGSPGGQACWGVLEVLIDTFIICTLTALVVLLSGIWREPDAVFPTPGAAAAEAFRRLLPFPGGSRLIALCLLFFAFSSIIGWGWYGEICWGYLFRGRTMLPLYRLLFALLCLPGALGSGTMMWKISDTLNALMAIPNLVSLLLLSGTAASICADYFGQRNRKTPRL
ncbi:MAG: alanine/glycine:cation symporter family protein [Clostridia bacterium]